MEPDIATKREHHVNASRAADRRKDIAALALLTLFAIALINPVLSGRIPAASDTLRLWSPHMTLGGPPVNSPHLADSALLYLPWNSFARQAIADGEWPLWDPYSFSGQSFAANSQSQLYYPLTWLLWLVPLGTGIQLQALFNLCLAGWGMYLLMRWWGVSRVGALISGLAFSGSAMLQTSIEIPGVATAYSWLPVILLALDRAIVQRSARWTALAALTVGLQLVSGHPQWTLYGWIAVAAWVLYRSSELLFKRDFRAATGALARSSLAAAGGLALAAVHLVPIAEMITHAGRAAAGASTYSIPPKFLLRILMPEYFGTALPGVGTGMVGNDLWYIGVAPLLLIGVALLAPPKKVVYFWAGLAACVAFILLGLGPFYNFRDLPVVSATVLTRIGYLLICFLAVLAGYGWDALARPQHTVRHRAIALLLSSLFLGGLLLAAWLRRESGGEPAGIALRDSQVGRALFFGIVASLGLSALVIMTRRGQKQRRGLALASVLLLLPFALDLLAAFPRYNTFVTPDRLVETTPSIEWLRNADAGRIISVDTPIVTFVPNIPTLHGFPTVGGYDSLHTRRYEEFWGTFDPTTVGGGYFNVFLRPQAYTSTAALLLNARYVTAHGELEDPNGVKEVFDDDISIYENERALPWALVVPDAEVLPRREITPTLTLEDFDPRATVLLEQEEQPPALEKREVASTAGRAVVTRSARNSMDISVDTPAPAWLLVSAANYPGWEATIDGVPSRVYTADYVLRAVPVTEGTHIVRMQFTPRFYWWSLACSLSSAAVILLAALIPRRRVH